MKLDYNKGIIYKITNLVNNKVYIGQTVTSLKERWQGHCYKQGCVLMHNAIKKYGRDSFTQEVIEEVPVEDLNSRETFWVKYYKSYQKEFGYNILIEGGHGRRGLTKLSEERIIELLNMYNKGTSYSELGRIFNMHRKSIKALLDRLNGTPIEPRKKSLKDKIDVGWLQDYLLQCNPTAKEIREQLGISSATLFKFTKKIGYKFLTYRQRQKLDQEYNSSTSVRQPDKG